MKTMILQNPLGSLFRVPNHRATAPFVAIATTPFLILCYSCQVWEKQNRNPLPGLTMTKHNRLRPKNYTTVGAQSTLLREISYKSQKSRTDMTPTQMNVDEKYWRSPHGREIFIMIYRTGGWKPREGDCEMGGGAPYWSLPRWYTCFDMVISRWWPGDTQAVMWENGAFRLLVLWVCRSFIVFAECF